MENTDYYEPGATRKGMVGSSSPADKILRFVAQDLESDRVITEAVLLYDVHRPHQRIPGGFVVVEKVSAK